jgi:hypothetical protein
VLLRWVVCIVVVVVVAGGRRIVLVVVGGRRLGVGRRLVVVGPVLCVCVYVGEDGLVGGWVDD